MTNEFKRLALAAAVLVLAWNAHAADERAGLKPGDAEVPIGIGRFWQSLFQWPSALTIRKKSILHFRYYNTSWLHKVISPSWLPPEDVKPMFLKAEVDDCDVVRLRWSKNGYDIQVAQTCSYFTIKLTPQDGSGTGKDDKEKLRCARDLCLRLFAPTGTHWSGQGRPIAIDKLPEKIASYSFTESTVKRSDAKEGVLLGRPRTMEEEGLTRPLGLRDDEPYSANWCSTPFAWVYWFRRVHWWNDGKSVGIRFVKHEGGPVDADATRDRTWFETGGRIH